MLHLLDLLHDFKEIIALIQTSAQVYLQFSGVLILVSS